VIAPADVGTGPGAGSGAALGAALAATRPRLAPMRRRHLPAVTAIEALSHPRPWSAGLFEAELGRDDRHYVTAWSDTVLRRHLLGYGGVQLVLGDAHITTVAVHPAVRRRGVGGHLVLALLEAAIRAGASAATLEVRADNQGAQRLYSTFGFAPVGVRPGYYTEPGGARDAIIMWAYDVDGPAYRRRLDRHRARLGWPPRPGAADDAAEVA
jgi:ribosomal-protein-alanine N-acetyltransferase